MYICSADEGDKRCHSIASTDVYVRYLWWMIMKNRQRNQALFFAFLNLTIVLTFLGSPSYAGIELDINVLKTIRNPRKTPDLRQFSDKDMQQIFMDIAKNNSTEHSKHFLERIKEYKAQHSNSKDLDKKTNSSIFVKTRHVPIAFEQMASPLRAVASEETVPKFNKLITLINKSGNKINSDDTISQDEKNNFFEKLNKHSMIAYLKAVDSDSEYPSLKIGLVNRLNSVTHRIRTVFSYVLDCYRSSNDAQKH